MVFKNKIIEVLTKTKFSKIEEVLTGLEFVGVKDTFSKILADEVGDNNKVATNKGPKKEINLKIPNF